MDTERARTFLTVIAAGNFIKAAERLFVTQSTVSSRIQSLEDQLGCRLFVRNKAGTTLTAAGRQFQKHAVNLMRTVEQARQDVGVPKGYRASLTIGGRLGIWEDLLLRWLPVMRTTVPGIALLAEIGFEEDLMLGLVDGRIDIGVMYTPQSRPGLRVEPLFEEELILVATEAGVQTPPMGPDYVYIDWGSEFRARHSTSFPDFTGPGLTTNVGWLGLQHILAYGGSGYFPRRVVAKHLATAQLHEVSGSPAFTLPAYLVYPADHDPATFDVALMQLRKIAAEVAAS
ncbi:MAG TPA: LysR family transcriptional regulator [Lacipirellulaceae bacterium]|nr:LysR family transcriptional regulator [Lacipirellulaceae bacterium]